MRLQSNRRDSDSRCTACGVPFYDHDGVQKTCHELQEARKEIAALREQLAEPKRDQPKPKPKRKAVRS